MNYATLDDQRLAPGRDTAEVEQHSCACGAGPEGACGSGADKIHRHMKPEEVRDLLRAVGYPGFSRDIVGAGFVKAVGVDGPMVTVEFAPNTRDEEKVAAMERGIRDVLYGASFVDVQIHTVKPFGEDSMILGTGTLNPLQAELIEEGIEPQRDVLRDSLRVDAAPGVGYRENGPEAFEGPKGPATLTYDGALPVLQWDIDPHDAAAESHETEVKVDGWDYRVWWQVHPRGDLCYVSLQAMREDWADHIGEARPHPVGRSEAVNIVYDKTRKAVVAIYGTVRDFRPFVQAFDQAYVNETGESAGPSRKEE